MREISKEEIKRIKYAELTSMGKVDKLSLKGKTLALSCQGGNQWPVW